MPGIAEALEQPKRKGGVSHVVGEHLDAMDADLRLKALQLLDSDKSDAQVAEAFRGSKFPCSPGAVRNYREAKRLSPRFPKVDQ